MRDSEKLNFYDYEALNRSKLRILYFILYTFLDPFCNFSAFFLTFLIKQNLKELSLEKIN